MVFSSLHSCYSSSMITYTFTRKETLSEAMMELFHIVEMLRSPGGCPWDRKQDSASIALNTLGETYEYLDALEKNDRTEISEELGDVLLNVMMLMEIHHEKPDFNIVDSVNDVCEKLVRRHPHVFSTSHAETPSQVLEQWERIKEEVEGKRHEEKDFFSRVPSSLPPMEMCREISDKAVKVGFDWPDTQGVIDQVCEELDETIEADNAIDRVQEDVEMEVGDLLFAVVNLARHLHVNPSLALHRSNGKFKRRFNEVVKRAGERNLPLDSAHVKEMNEIWDEVKESERTGEGRGE